MMELPKQNHKFSISTLAKKYNRSIRSIQYDLKALNVSKSREQYEADALARRQIAYELRQSGMKWAEIGEKLGISSGNARVLGTRYKQSLAP